MNGEGFMTFKYFAYGSNMLTERLCGRCPSATPIRIGTLKGYALEFSKPSRDGSGKGTIVKSSADGAQVLGVLFEIAKKELDGLDRAEGYGQGYDRRSDFAIELADDTSVAATSYFAAEFDRDLKPYDWYRALVIGGAKQHALPKEWVAILEEVAFHGDGDLNRKGRLDALKVLRAAGYEKLLEPLPA
jgi:gamma-glutamylcyclotransferase